MNEEELGNVWTTLEPTVSQLRRMDTRLVAWLDAHDTSLAAEWLGFVRVAPFAALGLAAASAVAIGATTPVLWLARALAGALG